MEKGLHAIQFDGSTFGMNIDASTEPYRKFKKAIHDDTVIGINGQAVEHVLTVPNLNLAAIMGGAHWLVSQGGYFDKIKVDGLRGEEWIYVKYSPEPIDFRHRRQPDLEESHGYWEG